MNRYIFMPSRERRNQIMRDVNDMFGVTPSTPHIVFGRGLHFLGRADVENPTNDTIGSYIPKYKLLQLDPELIFISWAFGPDSIHVDLKYSVERTFAKEYAHHAHFSLHNWTHQTDLLMQYKMERRDLYGDPLKAIEFWLPESYLEAVGFAIEERIAALQHNDDHENYFENRRDVARKRLPTLIGYTDTRSTEKIKVYLAYLLAERLTSMDADGFRYFARKPIMDMVKESDAVHIYASLSQLVN